MTPPESENSPESPSSSDYFKEAQDALQKQIWELAIEKFRLVLKKGTPSVDVHIGLGNAYEGKSRDTDGKPFLRLAMEEYRKAIRLNENFHPAHDALLAATVKAGLLEDVFEEYKYRASQNPQNPIYKNYIKKIETMLLLRADAGGQEGRRSGRKWVFLERLLVIGGLVSILSSVLVFTLFRQHNWALPVGKTMIKSGFYLIVVYLGFKIFNRK